MFLRNAWCKSCLYLSLTSTGIRSKITNGLITNMTAIKLPRTWHYASDYRLWLLWFYVLLHGSTPRQWRSRISVVVKALNAFCSISIKYIWSVGDANSTFQLPNIGVVISMGYYLNDLLSNWNDECKPKETNHISIKNVTISDSFTRYLARLTFSYIFSCIIV